MPDGIYRTRRQVKEGRMVIVAEMYKKGASIRKIAAAAQERMGLEKTPSTATILSDIHSLLKEWRKARIDDVDLAVQLELERIDTACEELWESWQKSKTDQKLKSTKRKGTLSQKGNSPTTTNIEQAEKEEINYGDPRYIAEIRQQLAERRKLMGLYAPDKIDASGNLGIIFKEVIDDGSTDSDTDTGD